MPKSIECAHREYEKVNIDIVTQYKNYSAGDMLFMKNYFFIHTE